MSRSPHIQLEVDFRRHPRMFRLGELLDVPWQVARVLVEDLWFHARQYGADVTSMPPTKIADDLSWPGDPEELIEALHRSEWLVTHGGRRMVAHWEERYEQQKKKRTKDRERKRRQRGHGRDVGNGQRFRVLERDGFKCTYCGSDQRLEVDHIVPRSRGGSNDDSNLTTACWRCNSGKSDIPLQEIH